VGVDVATLAVIHGIGFVEVASPPSKLVDYPQYGNRQIDSPRPLGEGLGVREKLPI